MITCPWCATAYKEYQPACEKCGGPIPEADQADTSTGEAEEEPPIPPAPPRPFSDSYAWRILASEGGAITSGVVAVLGFVFAILGLLLTFLVVTIFVGIPFLLLGIVMIGVGGMIFFWRYQRALVRVAVLRRGLATRGSVVRLEQIPYYRVNRQHPWEITYHYLVEWREFEGKLTTLAEPGKHLQPGRAATVLYLAESPEQSLIYPLP